MSTSLYQSKVTGQQIILVVLAFWICSCSKENSSNGNIGQGFEIYMPKKNYHESYGVYYSKFNLDTIELQDTPIIKYDDVKKYDTSSHTITLPFLENQLLFKASSVYGNMFIATLDKKPIYCGFYYPAISSVRPNYIFIEDVNYPVPDVPENKIRIGLSAPVAQDPRKNEKLINRLKLDNKILE